MSWLTKKIANALFLKNNFDLKKTLEIGDYSINFQPDQSLSIVYKKKILIEHLSFQGVYFPWDIKDLQWEKAFILPLTFRLQHQKNKIFQMFDIKHNGLQISGAINIIFRPQNIIIEQRYNCSSKAKFKIANILQLPKDWNYQAKQNSFVHNADNIQLNLFSTQEEWIYQKKRLFNIAFMQSGIKGIKSNKIWIVKSDNKGYETFKINIGEKNEEN